MRRINSIIAMLLFFGSFQGVVTAKPSSYTGPNCMGEFCFNVKSMSMLMTETAFVQKYGSGHREGNHAVAHCYKVSEQKLYVRFRPYHGEQRQIIDIFVSDKPSCPSAVPPKIPLKPLETEKGLRIGDPYKKVLALYGEPDIEEKADGIEKTGPSYQEKLNSAPFGDTRLRYLPARDTLLSADIYLHKGKVSAILISMWP
jgi:hypothetical protein